MADRPPTWLASMVEGLPIGILVANAGGRTTYANAAARGHIEAIGSERWSALMASGGSDGVHVVGEVGCRWIEVDACPGVEGVSGTVWTTRDVTSARLERMGEVQHAKLEAIGEALGHVSHRFRNILQAVVGLAGMLTQRADMPEDVRRRLGLIASEGERGVAFLEDMNRFRRRVAVASAPRDMRAFLADDVRRREVRLPEDVRCDLELPDAAVWAEVDEASLTEAVDALADNACRAMPDGGVLSVVLAFADTTGAIQACETLRNADLVPVPPLAPGRWAALAVRDTGSGIERERLARIWEPFFSTRDGAKGMGLATVYGIARGRGGSVAADSTPGRGTVVALYIQVVDPPA